MDLNGLIERARVILVAPREAWPSIAAEPTSVGALFRGYLAFVAAIPPASAFVKTCLIGYAWHGFRVYRLGVGVGLAAALVWYATLLITIYVLALVVDAFAASFGAQQNQVQALKVVGYACTAPCVAGFGQLLPGLLARVVALAGVAYGFYLLYLGLPTVMKAPRERAAAYAALSGCIALVLGWFIQLLCNEMMNTESLGAYD